MSAANGSSAEKRTWERQDTTNWLNSSFAVRLWKLTPRADLVTSVCVCTSVSVLAATLGPVNLSTKRGPLCSLLACGSVWSAVRSTDVISFSFSFSFCHLMPSTAVVGGHEQSGPFASAALSLSTCQIRLAATDFSRCESSLCYCCQLTRSFFAQLRWSSVWLWACCFNLSTQLWSTPLGKATWHSNSSSSFGSNAANLCWHICWCLQTISSLLCKCSLMQELTS